MTDKQFEAEQHLAHMVGVEMEGAGYSSVGNPGLAAIIAQLLAALLPQLLERCDLNPVSLQRRASKYRTSDRVAVQRMVRRELGWWRYWWWNGARVTGAIIDTGAAPECVPALGAWVASRA